MPQTPLTPRKFVKLTHIVHETRVTTRVYCDDYDVSFDSTGSVATFVNGSDRLGPVERILFGAGCLQLVIVRPAGDVI